MPLTAQKYLKPVKKLIQHSGGNFQQVAHLVDLKMMLDNRKKMPNSGSKRKEPSNSIRRQALSFAMVGVFLMLMMIQAQDIYFFMFVAQIMLMTMCTITMLAEYSVSLFDTRDNNLILPLPANGQTLGWARVLHILIYMLIMSFSMMLPAILFSVFKFGILSAILAIISVVLSSTFTLFFTVFIYLALIRFTSGERLKDTMMYLQIFMTIAMIVAYQILPRLMMDSENPFSLTANWFHLFIPPSWFASLVAVSNQPTSIHIISASIGLLFPIIAIRSISKLLFYGFNEDLMKLDAQSGKKEKINHTNFNHETWWFKFSKFVFVVKKSEIAVFRMMWKLCGRERLFKQSILPLLAYSVIIPAVSFFTIDELGKAETKYLSFLYFTIMTSSMIPTVLAIGSNKHSDWLYQALPNLNAASLFKGTIKAAMARFFLPLFLIISAPIFYFKGAYGIIDLTTVFLFNLMIASGIQYFQSPHFPFSQEKTAAQGGKTAVKIILIMAIAFPLGFAHAKLSQIDNRYVLILTAFFGLTLYLLNNKLFPKKYNWQYVLDSNSF